jgi:hypothetical protein
VADARCHYLPCLLGEGFRLSNPVELRGQRGVLYWYDRVWAVCLLFWSDDA